MCMMPMLAFAQAVLPAAWDFSNPGISNPPVGWTHSLGTSNLTYQSGIGDQVSIRLDQTAEYLQINFADKPGPLSYYIRSQYGSNPGYSGTFSIQESVDGSSWNDIRQFTDGQLGNSLARYQHNLSATSRFVRFYFTNKISGSNVQIDSVMIQTPPPPVRGINVLQNAVQLVNGGTFTFGTAASKNFTLRNFGTSANLVIDSVVMSGPNSSDFTIGTYDQSIAPNNGTGNLPVQFTAGGTGSRFGTVKIYSNDTERNPFEIDLYGIGGNFATEPGTQSNAVNISNVRTFTMNVSFGRASGGAEKYILLRKPAGSITEAPADGVTYKRGDYIGGAQVAYIGTDTALIKPTYILANTAYSFAAFAFNGPEGYENYNTASAPKASVTTLANEVGSYYAAVNPASSSFITTLATRIRAPHDTVFYSNYAPTVVNNYLTRDTSGGKKVVNCVYTGIAYIYEEPFLWQSSTNTTGILTREHTFAQSWMPTKTSISTFPEVNGREILEYNDLHHLFPADQNNANGVRSNLPFGIVVNVTATSPTGFGKKGTDSRGITVYEPKDDQKGNLARALFYMLVRYNGERGNNWRLLANQDINVLLQWHQQDPPDALEIARNEYIASIQHNRNPFIDNPTWVNRINFGSMTYIADPNAGSITVTAPAANATIVAGKNSTISWTSANVDSVLVELQTAPGVYKTIGKYLATLGSVSYRFNENATSTAAIRISKVSDASVNASSAQFSIVKSGITITAPTPNQDFATPQIVVKWTKSLVDSVNVKCYLVRNGAVLDSTVISSPVAADSAIVVVPLSVNGTYVAYVTEKDDDKDASSLATDSVAFTVTFTGLAENNLLNSKVSVYPVPSNGVVNVATVAGLTINSIEAYDITGRLVQSTNQHNLVLPGKGLYILHVITDKGMAVKKVTVQ